MIDVRWLLLNWWWNGFGQSVGMFASIWIYACFATCLLFAIHADIKLFLWFPVHGYITMAMAMAGLCLNRRPQSATFDVFDQQGVSLCCLIIYCFCLKLLLQLGGANHTRTCCQHILQCNYWGLCHQLERYICTTSRYVWIALWLYALFDGRCY